LGVYFHKFDLVIGIIILIGIIWFVKRHLNIRIKEKNGQEI
jgi:hypothetical protein